MRTPKLLYAHERMIYHPELLTCPHCGDLLVTCNYLAWDKTVQKLDRVLSVASRPGRCPHAMCVGSRLRLLSAEGQRLAPAGSTYGYDVVVHIGWWRQEARATYREIHTALASRVRISESHVGYLYQQVYLPLLACHERQHRERLAQIAQQQGGGAADGRTCSPAAGQGGPEGRQEGEEADAEGPLTRPHVTHRGAAGVSMSTPTHLEETWRAAPGSPRPRSPASTGP
jgi:hypothetical protein